ncbi:MAG: GNAT family N-acetyltransferase [Acidimicrobiales bacterium]
MTEVPAVIEVLNSASTWLRSRGIAQWPESFDQGPITSSAERGELYIAVDDENVVGTMTLQWSDPPFWGDRSDAGFLHRLAVRRHHAGLGRRLIDWADLHSELERRAYLCLDVMTPNLQLRRYYEALSFEKAPDLVEPMQYLSQRRWQTTLYQREVGRFRALDWFC